MLGARARPSYRRRRGTRRTGSETSVSPSGLASCRSRLVNASMSWGALNARLRQPTVTCGDVRAFGTGACASGSWMALVGPPPDFGGDPVEDVIKVMNSRRRRDARYLVRRTIRLLTPCNHARSVEVRIHQLPHFVNQPLDAVGGPKPRGPQKIHVRRLTVPPLIPMLDLGILAAPMELEVGCRELQLSAPVRPVLRGTAWTVQPVCGSTCDFGLDAYQRDGFANRPSDVDLVNLRESQKPCSVAQAVAQSGCPTIAR